MRLALALLAVLVLCSPVLGETVDLTFAPAESVGLAYVGSLSLRVDTPNQGTIEVKTEMEYTLAIGKADAKGVPITITVDSVSSTAMGQPLPSAYAGKECKGLWDKHALLSEALTQLPARSAQGDQFPAMLITSQEFMLPAKEIEVGGTWKGEQENGPSLVEDPAQAETKKTWEGTLVSLKDGVATIEMEVQGKKSSGGSSLEIKGKFRLDFDTRTWTLLRSTGVLDGTVHAPNGDVKFQIPEMKIELKAEPKKEG